VGAEKRRARRAARMSTAWRNRSERGSESLKRVIIWLAMHAGRSFCRVLLVPISAYFLATDLQARRASREFLARALGRPVTWRDTFRHLFVFATTLLDRVFLLHGRHRDLEVAVVNERIFEDAIAAGRGCLLLGSHLGSFEMLGVVGSVERNLAINMVMHREDSAGVRELLAGTGHAVPYKVIALGQPESMLRVKECLDRGEVVGILADRVYGREATRALPFLGLAARFSLSPFRLARITGAPVLTVFGLFRGGRRYEIVFERLCTPEPAPYVAILERQARRSPYNWFNFYDFWSA
jgi:predicted LPLAT superfamily acyltransferase